MDFRHGLLALALGLLSLSACGDRETEPVRWEGVAVEPTLEALERPTGVLSPASALEVGGYFVRHAPTILQVIRTLLRLFELEIDLPPPDEEDTGGGGGLIDPGLLTSTSLFVELACWGPQLLRPDFHFRYGSVRVDTDSVARLTDDAASLHGHLLLSYDECLMPSGTLRGASPAYYNRVGARDYLLLDFNTEVIDRDGELRSSIHIPLMLRDGNYQALYELEEGGTLRVEFDSDVSTFSIHGRDGARYYCTWRSERLECGAAGP